jgi:hypothetical protein
MFGYENQRTVQHEEVVIISQYGMVFVSDIVISTKAAKQQLKGI